jgi:hypothetical protein
MKPSTLIIMLRFCRLLLLLLTVFQISWNYLADLWLGVSIVQVTNHYRSGFVPAGYAFSIWGLIYLAQLVYAVVQLLPASRNKRIYDVIAVPLMMSYVFAIAWGALFRLSYIPLSFFCLFAMLVAAMIVYVKVFSAADAGQVTTWLTLPFSLYAGWLSVANIAGFSLWMVTTNNIPGAGTLIMMFLLAAIAGLLVLFSFDDHIYPLVISWALVAIWVQQQNFVGRVALINALTLLAVNAGWWLLRWRKKVKAGLNG